MGLFRFLRRSRGHTAVDQWHADWEVAVTGLDAAAPAQLAARLHATPPLAADVEVEEEMLQALHDVLALEHELARGALPTIETAHRAAAGERCHFSVPVSMPDDAAQPTGRLLLTAGRVAFAGGSRPAMVAWHAAREVIRSGRDLIVVRAGAEDGYRFRCNSFSDAICGAAIARYLIRAARRAGA